MHPGAGGVLGSVFAGYVPLAWRSPNFIIYFVANYRIHLGHFGQVRNFCDPNLVTFYLCMYLILNKEHFTFHLQYKYSGKFANRKHEELSYPKKSENVRPHPSNSIENATA